MVDGLLAAYLFIYVDDGRPIVPTKELFWEACRSWGSTCSWLGIQDASRKFQPPSQYQGTWAGTFTNTEGVVRGLVSQERWDNTWWLIAELVVMEREGRYGVSRAKKDSIIGFLVYVSRIYRGMTPYLNGVHLTMYSWIM